MMCWQAMDRDCGVREMDLAAMNQCCASSCELSTSSYHYWSMASMERFLGFHSDHQGSEAAKTRLV